MDEHEQCPVVWPEEETPAGVKNCTDCGLINHGSRMIWGEGNPHASIMVVLDNPGAREDREGNLYVCGTRRTLQRAAHAAGLGEEDLYVTYILKRRPRKAYDKEKTREICMRHLLAQMESKSPRFVFCLGNAAVKAFFADGEAEVKTLRQQWHAPRGIMTTAAYHPLAVNRRPNLWPNFVKDWMFLASAYRANQGSGLTPQR